MFVVVKCRVAGWLVGWSVSRSVVPLLPFSCIFHLFFCRAVGFPFASTIDGDSNASLHGVVCRCQFLFQYANWLHVTKLQLMLFCCGYCFCNPLTNSLPASILRWVPFNFICLYRIFLIFFVLFLGFNCCDRVLAVEHPLRQIWNSPCEFAEHNHSASSPRVMCFVVVLCFVM